MMKKNLMRVLVTGKLGRGKTFLAKSIVREWASRYDQVFVLDFFGEFRELAGPTVFIYPHIEQLEYFLKTAWRYAALRPRTLVVFDEVHQYTQPGELPAELYTKFIKFFRYSRHRNIETICIGQGITDAPPKIRRITEEFWVFQTTEPADLDSITKRWGKEAAARAAKLADFEYIKLSC